MGLITFNLVEGVFWIVLGIEVLLGKLVTIIPYKFAVGVILVIFGISDFVEISTEAWWQPWWLLVWKGLCIVGGLIFIILILKGGHNENER